MSWLQGLRPAPLGIDGRERARVVLGATLGILVTALCCHAVAAQLGHHGPWLFGPLGATAVLVFALPGSPLAQPWAALAGHACAAVSGLLAVALIPRVEFAAAAAVGGAVALMLALRCLHPPGGGTALLIALTGVHEPFFILNPVLSSVLLLVLAAMAYNRLTGRAYPQRPAVAKPETEADLDTVLARHNHLLDISREDLLAIIADTQLQGYQRRLDGLRCNDIMTKQLITVTPHTPLQLAWPPFHTHRVKALPVVDAAGCLAGIVTQADFLRAAEVSPEASFDTRLRMLRDWALRSGTAKLEQAGHIMSRRVSVAGENTYLAELIALFGNSGHHHIPVLAADQRLLGMITQSNVVAALCQQSAAAGAA